MMIVTHSIWNFFSFLLLFTTFSLPFFFCLLPFLCLSSSVYYLFFSFLLLFNTFSLPFFFCLLPFLFLSSSVYYLFFAFLLLFTTFCFPLSSILFSLFFLGSLRLLKCTTKGTGRHRMATPPTQPQHPKEFYVTEVSVYFLDYFMYSLHAVFSMLLFLYSISP